MSETPEEVARRIVEPWYRGPYNLHQMDTPEMLKEVADIAQAIRDAYERAAQTAEAVIPEYDGGYKGQVTEALQAAIQGIHKLKEPV